MIGHIKEAFEHINSEVSKVFFAIAEKMTGFGQDPSRVLSCDHFLIIDAVVRLVYLAELLRLEVIFWALDLASHTPYRFIFVNETIVFVNAEYLLRHPRLRNISENLVEEKWLGSLITHCTDELG